MRHLLFALLSLYFLSNVAAAQDIVGFPRADFGKVVLSQKQFGGSLESSIGNYNNEPIAKYGRRSLFARLGRPIGRLDILTDAGVFPCTAFLISDKYLLTNHHCVPGIIDDQRVKASRIEAVQLLLGYVRDGIQKGTKRFSVSPKPVETDRELDYSILEVFGNPSSRFGHLAVSSAEPEDNSPYWIIGHPMGEAQRISRENCQSDSPAVAAGQLRHRCDTLPGNSGSPVIDPGQRAAVALHHAGSSRKSINYAIPMAFIARHSKIVAKLASVSPSRNPAARRQEQRPGGQEGSSTGAWQGAWCLLKTRRSNKRCIDVAVEISNGRALGQLGKPGQPGYAKLGGTVDQEGTVKLQISGISKSGRRRGQPYSGRITGRIAGNLLRGSGALSEGRQMTLELKRAASGIDSARLPSESVATANGDLGRARAPHPYDGLWRLTIDNAIQCGKRSWSFPVQVVSGKVYGGTRMMPGSVSRQGSVTIEHYGRGDRSKVFRYAGTITQGGGQIAFAVSNQRCHGVAKMMKTGELNANLPKQSNVVAAAPSDGVKTSWQVIRTSQSCLKNKVVFGIWIDGSRVSGRIRAGMEISGRRSAGNEIEFRHDNVRSGGPGLKYLGRIEGNEVKGTFTAERGPCKGRFTAALRQQ